MANDDLITFTVTRPATNCPSFWVEEQNSGQLVVVIGPAYYGNNNNVECLVAHGFKNDNPGGTPNPVLVFTRELPKEAIGAFFDALLLGEVPPQQQPAGQAYPQTWWGNWISVLENNSISYNSPIAHSVDIPTPPSPPTGPKVALAGSIFGAHGVVKPAAFRVIESAARRSHAERVVS